MRAQEAASGERLELLRADGGATANRWLMQFQADVLGVPVSVPEIAETTALGAAYLAGIATGVWTTERVGEMSREADRYEPRMEPDGPLLRRRLPGLEDPLHGQIPALRPTVLTYVYKHGGVFPVHRGHHDEEVFETVRQLLDQGEMLLVYAEGGRSRSGQLREPKPGIGRRSSNPASRSRSRVPSGPDSGRNCAFRKSPSISESR